MEFQFGTNAVGLRIPSAIIYQMLVFDVRVPLTPSVKVSDEKFYPPKPKPVSLANGLVKHTKTVRNKPIWIQLKFFRVV